MGEGDISAGFSVILFAVVADGFAVKAEVRTATQITDVTWAGPTLVAGHLRSRFIPFYHFFFVRYKFVNVTGLI